ncbi:MAG: PrgI family protein [Patescibacteria group bacterium]|nr:PrgI family protein [Patescibacteria group bacterium]
MDQHPVPRQITTFEFKLIGFLTLRQFIYVLVFVLMGFFFYFITPIPFLNYLLGFSVGLFGLAFVFVPINDRPMEIWVKNLIKRLTSPTQYVFKKDNHCPPILTEIAQSYSYQLASNYLDSQQKLNQYLAQKVPRQSQIDKKNLINDLIDSKNEPEKQKQNQKTVTEKKKSESDSSKNLRKPFISGLVKNYRKLPLPGILIYIKDQEEKTIRILKTNSHGVFLSTQPFPPGDYFIEPRDPRQNYFFDRMRITINQEYNQPIEITSRELL